MRLLAAVCCIGFLPAVLRLLAKHRLELQVGPGSYTVPSRHGSRYPSYVPFSTSTQRGFDAEQTSLQVS